MTPGQVGGADPGVVEAGLDGRGVVGEASGWDRPVAPVQGPIRFARYAFSPNRLGYCGPDEWAELFDQATLGHDDTRLRSLERQFEGAYPYLELIARSNAIADPLDGRVVEAYWLGNPLAEAVRPREIGESLGDRFRPRLGPDDWRWLATKPGLGAVPTHAFHVLDVFPRIGMLRSGRTDRALEVIDACRIRWGRVIELDGSELVVSAVPLDLVEGRLRLGPARPERVECWRDGRSFAEEVRPGDVVSIHWSWACERLDGRRLANLRAWTEFELGIANRTM